MGKEDEIKKRKAWLKTTSIIFFIVALLHFSRIIFGFAFRLGSWDVPLWINFTAVVLLGFLSIKLYKLASEK